MNKTILYSITVLVVLVFVVVMWSFTTPVGAFKGGIPGKPPNGGDSGKFDFSLSANPSSGTVTQGHSITSTITAALLKGKSKSVVLYTENCPVYTTCSLNPGSGKPTFSSTLTIETSEATPLGSHLITINGAGGGRRRSTTYTLTVNSLPSAICGNAILESGEVCDDGNNLDCNPYPGCTADCSRRVECGNNIAECGEQCDGTDDSACPGLCDTECKCVPHNTATKDYRVLLNATGFIGNETSGLFVIVTPTTPLFTGFYEIFTLTIRSTRTLQDNTVFGLMDIDTSGITNTANVFLNSTVDFKEDTVYQHQEKTISLEVPI